MKRRLCVKIGAIAIGIFADIDIAHLARREFKNFQSRCRPAFGIRIASKGNTVDYRGETVFCVKNRYDIIKNNGVLRFITNPRQSSKRDSQVLELNERQKKAALYLPDLKNYRNRIAFDHPFDQLLMMNLLARKRGVLLHSCGIIHKGSVFLFPGLSGAGKTTISRILHKNGFSVLSDDRIILRRVGEKLIGYGTPWPGAGGFALARSASIREIFFLVHGKRNHVVPLSRVQAIERLMTCAFVPFWDRYATQNALDFFIGLSGSLKCSQLSFLPDDSVISFLKKHYL